MQYLGHFSAKTNLLFIRNLKLTENPVILTDNSRSNSSNPELVNICKMHLCFYRSATQSHCSPDWARPWSLSVSLVRRERAWKEGYVFLSKARNAKSLRALVMRQTKLRESSGSWLRAPLPSQEPTIPFFTH
jgi:hypothetical protein